MFLGPNQTDRLVHDFAIFGNQRFTASNSHILANMRQMACWGRPMNTTVARDRLQATASDLMTSPEAATYLRISKGMLRHWVSDRKIEFVKLGRAVRFRKAHLDQFISQNLQQKDSRA
jgi:excisionase family DNA binding protein